MEELSFGFDEIHQKHKGVPLGVAIDASNEAFRMVAATEATLTAVALAFQQEGVTSIGTGMDEVDDLFEGIRAELEMAKYHMHKVHRYLRDAEKQSHDDEPVF